MKGKDLIAKRAPYGKAKKRFKPGSPCGRAKIQWLEADNSGSTPG